MRRIRTIALFVTALGAVFAGDAPAQQLTAHAEMIGPDGSVVGRVELRETPNYGVLLHVRLEGIEPGEHAIHIHETGRCETPDFDSAGGHYAPRGRMHGLLHPHGKHAGDLANLHVPSDGTLETQRLAHEVTLVQGATATLLDDDGSAIVVHAAADDYESQPSGAGGAKVACGVIRR